MMPQFNKDSRYSGCDLPQNNSFVFITSVARNREITHPFLPVLIVSRTNQKRIPNDNVNLINNRLRVTTSQYRGEGVLQKNKVH